MQEQINYYAERAAEYDQQRDMAGWYADAAAPEDPQGRDIDEAQSALQDFAIGGDVLKLAWGTGW